MTTGLAALKTHVTYRKIFSWRAWIYFHVERLLWIGAKIGNVSIAFLTVCVWCENEKIAPRQEGTWPWCWCSSLSDWGKQPWCIESAAVEHQKQARHILVGSAPIYGNLWSFSFFLQETCSKCVKNNVCKMFLCPPIYGWEQAFRFHFSLHDRIHVSKRKRDL